MKKYLIYWDCLNGTNGNMIIRLNPKTIHLDELIQKITHASKQNLHGIAIKFMVELK